MTQNYVLIVVAEVTPGEVSELCIDSGPHSVYGSENDELWSPRPCRLYLPWEFYGERLSIQYQHVAWLCSTRNCSTEDRQYLFIWLESMMTLCDEGTGELYPDEDSDVDPFPPSNSDSNPSAEDWTEDMPYSDEDSDEDMKSAVDDDNDLRKGFWFCKFLAETCKDLSASWEALGMVILIFQHRDMVLLGSTVECRVPRSAHVFDVVCTALSRLVCIICAEFRIDVCTLLGGRGLSGIAPGRRTAT